MYRGYIEPHEADAHLAGLEYETEWKQEKMLMYSKELPVPRLSAWYGDTGDDVNTEYTYSGIKMRPSYWTGRLIELKNKVEQACGGASFNSVLVNKYRDEYDGVSWHADDESTLGACPIIGSISLGASRRFQLRRRYSPGERPSKIISVDLHHGDVLVMRGATQRNWLHQIPKKNRKPGPTLSAGEQIAKRLLGNADGDAQSEATRSEAKPQTRINLTFRTIYYN